VCWEGTPLKNEADLAHRQTTLPSTLLVDFVRAVLTAADALELDTYAEAETLHCSPLLEGLISFH
jgi:hypothetical protein